MPSRDIKDLDAALQPLAQRFLSGCNADPVFTAAGAHAFLTCTYRSNDEQAAAYAKGRDANGKIIDRKSVVTDEPPGHSAHNHVDENGLPAARAFDFAIGLPGAKLDWSGTDPLWLRAVSIGESLGIVSGSHWKTPVDRPHFELANWRTYGQGPSA